MRTEHCSLCGKEQPVVANLLKALAEMPERLLRLVRGLTKPQLLKRPAPGKWSIQEIVCHLADAEVANAWRYRKVLAEDEFALTTWNQDRWAAAHNYRRQDLRQALEQLRTLRARNLALMKLVERKAWSRTAMHPTLGPVSAAQIFTHQVHHGASHLAQIERIRNNLKHRALGA